MGYRVPGPARRLTSSERSAAKRGSGRPVFDPLALSASVGLGGSAGAGTGAGAGAGSGEAAAGLAGGFCGWVAPCGCTTGVGLCFACGGLVVVAVVVCPSAPGAIRSVPHNSSLSSDAGAGMVMRNACQVGTSRVKRDARRLRFCHLAASKGGSVLCILVWNGPRGSATTTPVCRLCDGHREPSCFGWCGIPHPRLTSRSFAGFWWCADNSLTPRVVRLTLPSSAIALVILPGGLSSGSRGILTQAFYR